MMQNWARSRSNKPLCVACNRPFDPSSPGATVTMGPTCAKRAGLSTGNETQMTDFQLTLDESQLLERTNLPAPIRKTRRSSSMRVTGRNVPRSLFEKFVDAKIAFDELYREFCAESSVLYGDPAFAAYQSLISKGAIDHSLTDPVLKWLEPEHELHLVIDHESNGLYYWRVLNGSYTLLKIDLRHSQATRESIAKILLFSAATQMFREAESAYQLSLSEHCAETKQTPS